MSVFTDEERENARTFLTESERCLKLPADELESNLKTEEFENVCHKVLNCILQLMARNEGVYILGPVHVRIFIVAFFMVEPIRPTSPPLRMSAVTMLLNFRQTIEDMVEGDSWEQAKGSLPNSLLVYIQELREAMKKKPDRV